MVFCPHARCPHTWQHDLWPVHLSLLEAGATSLFLTDPQGLAQRLAHFGTSRQSGSRVCALSHYLH